MHSRLSLPVATLFLSLSLSPGFGMAAVSATACKLTKGDEVAVIEVVDGETLKLEDGRVLKLAGIEAPRLAYGKARGWPYAGEARDALAAMLKGQTFRLGYGRVRSDRYGRVVAFLLPESGPSVEERLVGAGFARVMPTKDMRACADDLLATEARARAAGRGLWADPFYAVRDAADIDGLERLEGSYQLVEGIIVDAAAVRGRIYLNFGDDRQKDFTVTVAPADVRLFRTGERQRLVADLSALKGVKVRVRGFVGRFNGPEIVVTVPEQIEFPDEEKDPTDGGGKKKNLAAKRAG